MVTREQLKLDIDLINESHIETLHRIIRALVQPLPSISPEAISDDINPLKDSVIFEDDLISPLEVTWAAEHSRVIPPTI